MTPVVVGWDPAEVPGQFDHFNVQFPLEGSGKSPCPPQEHFQISMPRLPPDWLQFMLFLEHKCKALEWQLKGWKKSYHKEKEQVKRLQHDNERLRKEACLQHKVQSRCKALEWQLKVWKKSYQKEQEQVQRLQHENEQGQEEKMQKQQASNQEQSQRPVIELHDGAMPEAPLPFLPRTPPPTCAGKANFGFQGPEAGALQCPGAPKPIKSFRLKGLVRRPEMRAGTELRSAPGSNVCAQRSKRLSGASIASTAATESDSEQGGLFLPGELLSVLLEFLPVAEVAKMQTRAVSSFFSNSKVWVMHLFKLMDIDSVLQQFGDGPHPVCEFLNYRAAFERQRIDSILCATELTRNASEGLQGYRLWFNGHLKWHAHHPEVSSRLVKAVMEWFRCGVTINNIQVGQRMCHNLLNAGIRDLRVDIANGLLSVLMEDHSSASTYQLALDYLQSCQTAFPFLSKSFALNLLEVSSKLEQKEGDSWKAAELHIRTLVRHIVDAFLPAEESHCATLCSNAMNLAHQYGTGHEFWAKKAKLIAFLS